MNEYKRLVVGVELRPRSFEPPDGSHAAVRQAAWLAAKSGASVLIVHSTWDGRDEPAPDLDPAAVPILDGLVAYCATLGVEATYAVEHERPWMAIARHATASDLVLTGKRDGETVDGARVGPTAAKLVRACTAPVWLVEPGQDQALKLVLAATDLSPVGLRVVEAAAWLAAAHGAELHIVHAWRVPRAVQAAADTMDHDEYVAAVEQHRLRALGAFERAVSGLEVDPTLHLERGRASERILGRIEVLQPDLVVMGSLSLGGRPGLFVGETAERVIPRLETSILTFKPKDFPSPFQVR
ncbi:MAG: universal stress protein [Planctomycetota bacterium]